jgi:hypothetical protein
VPGSGQPCPVGFIAGFHLALLVSVGVLLIGCMLAALIPQNGHSAGT